MTVLYRFFVCFFVWLPAVWGAQKLYILPSSANPVVELIKGATQSIEGCVYKLDYEPIVEALLAKARHGLRVRLLVEAQPFQHDGSDNALTPIERLRQAGVVVDVAHEDASQRHAKCFLIDGQKSVFMTANLDTETFLGTKIWREKGVGGDAPARDIILVDDDPRVVDELKIWLSHIRDPESTPQPERPYLAVGPYISTRDVLARVISEAKTHCYIWQQSVQDEEIVVHLMDAQKRGVDVTIVMTEDPFHKGDSDPNLPMLKKLTRAGVSVYRVPTSTTPYIHMKGLLIDNNRFFFTTANFYGPSLDEGLEMSFWVMDHSAVTRLKTLFAQDKNVAQLFFDH